MPRILVSQPEHCCPLVDALAGGDTAVEARTWPKTLAEGTAIAQPVRDREVLAAIRGSGGAATAVAEEELLPAVRELARTGVFAEPTSAQVLPALRQFHADGHISPDDTVVLVLTGSGLKASQALSDLITD